MPIKINDNKGFDAFAMIVDINGFTKMVSEPEANAIAQYVGDILGGGVAAVEKNNGNVVGFMGDAFLAFIENADEVFKCCVSIANDLDKTCEYISSNSSAFPFNPKGPSLKIGIEYGYIDVSNIQSNFLGKQKLFISEAINYASRISNAGSGNRCLLGPSAYRMGLNKYTYVLGPNEIRGKCGEPNYIYYQLSLDDIWREGDSEESFWG